MTTRRGFLKAMLAAGVAPYVSTSAGVLMPVRKIATLGGLLGLIAETPQMTVLNGIDRGPTPYNFTEQELRLCMEKVYREASSGSLVRMEGAAWWRWQ